MPRIAHRGAVLQVMLLWTAAIFSLSLAVGYGLGVYAKGHYWFDQRGYVVGVDFLNNWTMGKFAREEPAPEANYHREAYTAKLHQMISADYKPHQWSYPPSYVMMMVPFGYLSYRLAWAVGILGSIAFFYWIVRRVYTHRWRLYFSAGVASPAAFMALVSGQLTLLFSAIQIALFHILDRRPVLAGILLGFLSIKPQLGVVYPFFLMATGRWRVFLAAALTTLFIAAISALLLGWPMWEAYLNIGAKEQQAYVLNDTFGLTQKMMPTIFMDLRNVGVPFVWAMAAQFAVAVGVMGSFLTRSFRRLSVTAQQPIVAAGTVLVTPYLMAYDVLFFTFSVYVFLEGRQFTSFGAILMGACFWLPMCYIVAAFSGVAGVSFLPLIFILWCFHAAPSNAVNKL